MRCFRYLRHLKRRCNHSVTDGYSECYQHRKFKYPRPSECPICFFHFPKYYVPLSPCQHWVCPDCIIRSGKEQCPLCRTQIKIPDKHKFMLKYHGKTLHNHIQNQSLEQYLEGNDDELLRQLRNIMNNVLSEISGRDDESNISSSPIPESPLVS